MRKLVLACSLASILFSKAKPTITWNFRGRYYAEECKIVRIYDQGTDFDMIEIRDANGHTYYFNSDAGDWWEGDYVSCIMDSKGSPYVMDDVVVSAKYSRPDLLG